MKTFHKSSLWLTSSHTFIHNASLVFRPEILKQEIKVFFVKYNDPIYVKLEKLDIMIRLASQANIAQVSYCSEPHGKSLKSQHRSASTRGSRYCRSVTFRCWQS